MSRKQRKRREQKAKRTARKGKRDPGPAVELAPAPYAGRKVPLERLDGTRYRVPQTGAMRTHGVVYADERILPDLEEDRCLEQVANVATLPGIVGPSLAMPDIHWGYGFPIGGVAAFDPDEGVVSPGGVGYDINCGVRLLASDVSVHAVKSELPQLVNALFKAVPAGVGSARRELGLDRAALEALMRDGVGWAVQKGLADEDDALRVEEGGCLQTADPAQVSERALARGLNQVGTLGSGNHFAEVGVVDEVYDEAGAKAFGLRAGQITLMIHSGSRGLGHQVCTDFLADMLRASERFGIPLVDRQLCCAPVRSEPGQRYLAAMGAAANFAFVNRQVMTHWARRVFDELFGGSLRTVYDVCHNIAKLETHTFEGSERELLVHRKGATRALPAGHPLVPAAYRDVGQPVIIPGDMGRYSFVLRGAAHSGRSFGSACHGAGRLLSRAAAKRRYGGENVAERLRKERGVIVRGASRATVVEEVPEAYKDAAEVVGIVHDGGLAERVVRIRPLGVVKG